MGRNSTAPTTFRTSHVATGSVLEEPSIVPAVVLLGGLTAGLLAQGGFYAAGRVPLFLAVAVSFVVALVAVRPSRADLRLVPATAAVTLAGWALLRGLPTDDPGSGIGMATLLAAFAAVLLVVRRQGLAARDLLLTGLLGAGVVVATLGWVGVVWHRTPWALPNDGVWRATSTLTYANATAAILVPLFLVSLGLLIDRPRDASPVGRHRHAAHRGGGDPQPCRHAGSRCRAHRAVRALRRAPRRVSRPGPCDRRRRRRRRLARGDAARVGTASAGADRGAPGRAHGGGSPRPVEPVAARPAPGEHGSRGRRAASRCEPEPSTARWARSR